MPKPVKFFPIFCALLFSGGCIFPESGDFSRKDFIQGEGESRIFFNFTADLYPGGFIAEQINGETVHPDRASFYYEVAAAFQYEARDQAGERYETECDLIMGDPNGPPDDFGFSGCVVTIPNGRLRELLCEPDASLTLRIPRDENNYRRNNRNYPFEDSSPPIPFSEIEPYSADDDFGPCEDRQGEPPPPENPPADNPPLPPPPPGTAPHMCDNVECGDDEYCDNNTGRCVAFDGAELSSGNVERRRRETSSAEDRSGNEQTRQNQQNQNPLACAYNPAQCGDAKGWCSLQPTAEFDPFALLPLLLGIVAIIPRRIGFQRKSS